MCSGNGAPGNRTTSRGKRGSHSEAMPGCGLALARERVHQPAQTDAHRQESKERNGEVLGALLPAVLGEKSKNQGDEESEERHRLEVRELEERLVHVTPSCR